MEAIILAGGFGTRLKQVLNDRPKSMALINGRPFLEYLLDFLLASGVNRAVLSVGYMRDMIMNHFGSRYRTMLIDYAVEEEPMGTGGGIRLALWKVEGMRAFALNGDSLFRVDLNRMMQAHAKKRADISIALRELQDTSRYGRVKMNKNRRIEGFEEKQQDAGPGYINGGIYIIEKLFLMEPEFRGRFSIEKDCFEHYVSSAKMFGFPSKAYFLDIGIPETYKKAQDDFQRFGD